VMGFKPESIGYIKNAAEHGLGEMYPTVVGEDVEAVKRRFKPPASWKEAP